MRKVALMAVCALAPLALGNVFELPLNTLDYQTVTTGANLQVVTEGSDSFVRISDMAACSEGLWNYRIDLTAANGGVDVDGDVPGARLEFDIRYTQEGVYEGIDPYSDAAINLQVEDSTTEPMWWGGEIWMPGLYVVGSSPDPAPEGGVWYHISIDFIAGSGNEQWTPSQTMSFALSGRNLRVGSSDSIDIKNLAITPEPTSLVLLAIGALGALRRR